MFSGYIDLYKTMEDSIKVNNYTWHKIYILLKYFEVTGCSHNKVVISYSKHTNIH